MVRLPAYSLAIAADLPTATILPACTATAASRMMRRCGSTVMSQPISAISKSTDCTARAYFL